MMTPLWLLLFAFFSHSYGAEFRENIRPKQLLLPENHFAPGVFDFNFLNSQAARVPQYNFGNPENVIPRYQPQFLFYGGGPGQPFLLNPGPPQPNNFLIPQAGAIPQGPGVIFRNNPQGPQSGRPLFAGGFPNQKPQFVPPVEKDAEQIPTNPAKVPPFKPNKKPVGKPEKIETFNEAPIATEADGLLEKPQPKTPAEPKPGHRYFVLNGQPLFNYPLSVYQPQNLNPDDVLRYSQNYPQTHPQDIPVPVIPALQNPALFDGKTNGFPLNYDPYQGNQGFPQINQQSPVIPSFLQNVPLNLIQPYQYNHATPQQVPARPAATRNSEENTKSGETNSVESQPQIPKGLFKTALPFSVIPKDGQSVQIRVSSKDFNLRQQQPGAGFLLYPNENGAENDAVVIDAKDENESQNSDVVTTAPNQSQEASLAQAGPGAIALAGPGGVAAAAPKATAFVGKEGMAVSSPKATAIAGPAKDEQENDSVDEEDDLKKETKKEKKEKYIRQRFRGRYQ